MASECGERSGGLARQRRWTGWLVAVGLMAAVWLVFGQSWRYEFLTWDDEQHLLVNPHINPPSWEGLRQIWIEPYWGLYIPLSYTFFALEALLALRSTAEGGTTLQPWVFHVGNLLLHSGCVLLVFGLLRRLLDAGPNGAAERGAAERGAERAASEPAAGAPRVVSPGVRDLGAGAGALLFALHPVQVESVAWISEARGLLCALFCLVSVLAYLSFIQSAGTGRRTVHYLLATLALVLALLSKPAAVAVPLLVGVLGAGWLRRPWLQVLADVGLWLVMVLGWTVFTKWHQPDPSAHFVVAWYQRPLVAGDALTFYLGNLLFPFLLGPDYGRSPGWLLEQWWAYVVWVPVVGMIGALACLRGRRIWLVGVGLWVAWLLPVLGLVTFDFQRISTVADRYLYLAMLGPALVLAWAVERLWEVRKSRVRAGVGVAVAAWLALLGAKSFVQTRWWQNSQRLVLATLEVNIDSVVGWTHRGVLLSRQGRVGEAIECYLYALKRHPNHAELHYNLGVCLAELGEFDQAERELREALRLKPDWALVDHDLARLLAEQGRLEEAVKHFRRAIDAFPAYVDARLNLGAALEKLGRTDEARRQYEVALKLQPDSPLVHYNLANLLLGHEGDLDQVAAHYRETLRHAPYYARAHANLGIVLLRQRKYEQSLKHLREAVRLNPRLVPAWTNLGRALLAGGRKPAAAAAFRQALRLVPAESESARTVQGLLEKCETTDESPRPEETGHGAAQTDPPSGLDPRTAEDGEGARG